MKLLFSPVLSILDNIDIQKNDPAFTAACLVVGILVASAIFLLGKWKSPKSPATSKLPTARKSAYV